MTTLLSMEANAVEVTRAENHKLTSNIFSSYYDITTYTDAGTFVVRIYQSSRSEVRF